MSAVALPRQEHGIMACLLLALLSPSLVAPAVARGAATGCKIVNTSLAVTIEGLKPQISAKINGNDVKFTVDSGAFYSILSPASAAENHLTLKPAPFGLMGQGIGGTTTFSLTTVSIFTLADTPFHDIQFLVGGSEVGQGSVGVLGQNVLRIGDMEYDLAQGLIRLSRAENCKGAMLAYWVLPDQPYSVMDLNPTTPAQPHTTAIAYLNGQKIKVLFDTGAPFSALSLKAAERAGIKLGSPEVSDAGYIGGFGRGRVKQYLARVASFKIGNEEIRNTRLRIEDTVIPEGDMLLGMDFFLSHHIYVANGQRKLYFTYNGGPVFNLTGNAPARSPQEPAVSSAVSTDTQAAAGVVEPPVQADQAGHADLPPLTPGDPAELSRVGMAAAGRRDFETALADLNRAVELAPDNPDYLFQRGSVHWQNRQPDLAMADFNRAIELKPDHVPALMDRAEMRIAGKNIDGAKSDLDAVDKTAAQQADVRLELARAYERAGLLESSIAQYELWTTSHQVDSRFGGALVGLCVTRALLNEDLPKALRNCNDAFKLAAKGSPLAAGALGGRGLVRLRLGDTDKAIADFDDSLKLNPRSAWSLYARGIAKVRKSKTAEGEGDMAEAAKIAPHIADQFTKWGITP